MPKDHIALSCGLPTNYLVKHSGSVCWSQRNRKARLRSIITFDDSHFADIWARSTTEGVVEERGEKVLGLTQCLPLHCPQALDSLRQGRELFL